WGKEDRPRIDMIFVEPPAANLACEIAMSRAAIGPYKSRTADGRISNSLAEIRQQSGDHRAACHRTLHTRGNVRAVSRSFLQILCSLVKRRAPATNGRRLLTSCCRPSRASFYADASALFYQYL